MKFKFVLLMSFSALAGLAMGQNKPKAMIDPKGKRYWYYYEDTNRSISQIQGDMVEFCQNLSAHDNSGRKVPKVVVDSIFICEVGDFTTTTLPLHKDEKRSTVLTTTSKIPEPTAKLHKSIGEGYTYHSTINGWMKLHLTPTYWTEARLRCAREGSTLASPVDLPMLNAMKDLLDQKVSVIFTGISEIYAPGYFFSVEGVSLDNISATFGPDEPDFRRDISHCISMFSNGTITFSNCEDFRPFICYVKDSDVPETESPCGEDPDYIYDSRTSQCYKYHSMGRSWSSAFIACANEGGHLAIINSDVEAQILVDLINKHPESSIKSENPLITFLGFQDWSESDTWMTINGQTLKQAGYSRWAANKPSNPRAGFCGSMMRTGELSDAFCMTRMPFVCEKNPDSFQ